MIKLPRAIAVAFAGMVIVAVGLFAAYCFIVYPKLKPMLNYDWASNISRTLSQSTSSDLSVTSIPIPLKEQLLTHDQVKILLKYLNETKRFKNWSSDISLLDADRQPFAFWIRPLESKERGAWLSSSEDGTSHQGDFIFRVTSVSGTEIVEH
jgi:hypothetical protein